MMTTMAKDNVGNSYEEARKLRVLDNKKRFEDLGILSISKTLTEISKTEKKTTPRKFKPKQSSVYALEPRRSTRERNSVPSYRDDVDLQQLPTLRKRAKFSCSSTWASLSYLARPLEEVKSATYEQRAAAFKAAEKIQSNLESGNPSFVKSMVRSHVYSCFWLGLPSRFCEDHLPKSTIEVVLENEEGSEYEAVYIGKRVGLSGGWRAFALDHKLDDGDALVFEMVEPTRFKIYIVKAFDESNQIQKSDVSETSVDADDDDNVDVKAKEKQETIDKKFQKKKVTTKAQTPVPKTTKAEAGGDEMFQKTKVTTKDQTPVPKTRKAEAGAEEDGATGRRRSTRKK